MIYFPWNISTVLLVLNSKKKQIYGHYCKYSKGFTKALGLVENITHFGSFNEEVDVNHKDAVKKALQFFQLSDVQQVRPQTCDENNLRTCAWSDEVIGTVFTELHSYISVKIHE